MPIHYAIELEPNLESLTLAGAVVVDIEVREPTAQVVVNAVNMTLTGATADETQSASIALDAAAETATLTFPQPLAVGPHKLRIGFTAQINRFGRGLFYVDYPTEQGTKRMISSHLEPADARRVFPCWDEPAFKATFALTVTVPRSFLAVSNMPVAHEEPVTPSLKQVTFATTPKMSSYLFVLAAGELERLSAQADGVTVSVVTTAGKRAQGRFALDTAIDLLRYFNDYFGIKYPLPKLDLIAVPGGFGGAMENWGAITFFESRLLFDPATNADAARRGIFSLVAHEIAHQWFGNLVTMGWWDNLWLNEGFATWMQVKAAEHLYPQWQSWLNSNERKQNAMSRTHGAPRTRSSSRSPTKPRPWRSSTGITYSKGQAVIRMLESYLGEETFRAGIRKYMADHAYGNTTTADLWRALEAASGKPVATIAATFTEQAGVPLVVARGALRGRRAAHRAAAGALHHPRPDPRRRGAGRCRWRSVRCARCARPKPCCSADEPREIAAGRCGEPVKLNLGDVGYYRVEYDAASRAALAKSLGADVGGRPGQSARRQLGAGGSGPRRARLLSRAGRGDRQRRQPRGVGAGDRHLQPARSAGAQSPGASGVGAYARAKLRPVFDRLGWDAAGPDADDGALLRARLIRVLGEARRRGDSGRSRAGGSTPSGKIRHRSRRRCATP